MCAWIAFVFVWYLQFKFTGDDGSVWLFTVLTDWLGFHGHEKIMRIGTGSAELIASILLFDRPLQVIGALLSLCIMSGAIFFHVVRRWASIRITTAGCCSTRRARSGSRPLQLS